MCTVKLKIEKDFAEELVAAIQNVLNHDDNTDFLCIDDYDTLKMLKDTLLFKLGRVL